MASPILIKDNLDTRDRMQTTAGSLALEGSHARRDAFIVKQLRSSGAVILGKTNLSEWANFRGKHSVSGWSSRGGLTKNPYVLDRTAPADPHPDPQAQYLLTFVQWLSARKQMDR